MNYLEEWTQSLLVGPELRLKGEGTARGECRRHTGPSLWFAAVTLRLAPASELLFRDELEPQVREKLHVSGWYNEIIFGVLDVLVTDPVAPVRRFELTILGVEIDDIESRGIAFRLAARDAAQNMLGKVGIM